MRKWGQSAKGWGGGADLAKRREGEEREREERCRAVRFESRAKRRRKGRRDEREREGEWAPGDKKNLPDVR